MKIYELFNYYADFYNDFDKQKAEAMLMGLRIDINDRAGSLSKGNMEKLQLILQMSRNAKIYLLDEPIGGVDLRQGNIFSIRLSRATIRILFL